MDSKTLLRIYTSPIIGGILVYILVWIIPLLITGVSDIVWHYFAAVSTLLYCVVYFGVNFYSKKKKNAPTGI